MLNLCYLKGQEKICNVRSTRASQTDIDAEGRLELEQYSYFSLFLICLAFHPAQFYFRLGLYCRCEEKLLPYTLCKNKNLIFFLPPEPTQGTKISSNHKKMYLLTNSSPQPQIPDFFTYNTHHFPKNHSLEIGGCCLCEEIQQ